MSAFERAIQKAMRVDLPKESLNERRSRVAHDEECPEGSVGDISLESILPCIPDAVDFPPEAREFSARERREMSQVLTEMARRAKDPLRLYEPTHEQDGFHRSLCHFRVIRGSNRSGKTLAASVEFSRAIRCCDPYGKWPKKGRIIIVGKDLLHCSKVIYRKMYKPGAFRIIRDLKTREWRTYNWKTDEDRVSEAEDAPPLIPFSCYGEHGVSWENKREEIPRSIAHKNGWEVTFFSGEGEPPKGWDVDGCMFDESIPHPAWLKEIKARLVDRAGRFIWSATPQEGCGELIDLSEQAFREMDDPEPRVSEHFVTIDMNPWLSDKVKDDFKRDYADDEDEYNVRILGEFATSGMRVYPEFTTRGVHRIEAFPIDDKWCRYVAIDPGRQVAAALFIAVPPRHVTPQQPIVYDEIYYKKANAELFATEMKRKIGGQWIHRWIIDSHEGNKHETGSGKTIESQYVAAFIAAGLKDNGFTGFQWAADDVNAGILAFKSKLHIVGGAPVWLFMTELLPKFCWEISRYVNKRMTKGGLIVDLTSRSNLHNHLMDCARYLAMYNPKYHEPPPRKYKAGYANEYLARKRKKRRAEQGWGDCVKLG